MSFRKYLLLGLITASTFFLSGCPKAFTVVESDYKPSGKTIAVVAGINDEVNLALAAVMTDALKKHSRYEVVSQRQVAKVLGSYPQNIKGPYSSAIFSINVDWSHTDVEKIAAIQKSLKVDYVYVLWAPIASKYNNSKVSQFHVVSQMYRRSDNKEIGEGQYFIRYYAEDDSYIKEDSEGVAMRVAQSTQMTK